MKIAKGTKIRQTRENANEMFKNTTANGVLVYEVTRVNKTSYTLKCVEGYMKGTGCYLGKDFKNESVDIYGTVTRWEVVA